MKEKIPPIENSNQNLDNKHIENLNENLDENINNISTRSKYSKWIDNQGDDVKEVFGFNSSAELVNGRAAMVGFIMLVLTELVLKGKPVTSSIFGIN